MEADGLENSEHIRNIVIDPRNSNIVYVTAIRPLWSAGGDRGLYKTTDGGQTWKAVLSVSRDTGGRGVAQGGTPPSPCGPADPTAPEPSADAPTQGAGGRGGFNDDCCRCAAG